jgi:signal transduction histidine kinase/uncharacterized protein YoaH (UPF0181 family)
LLAAVLEAATQPICVVDPDDVIKFANPAAVAALGYDAADELLGRRGHEVIPASCVSVPIELPGGRGAVVAFTDMEDRLREEQQASVRRVATLVAGGAESAEVFAAIAREVGQVLGVPMVEMSRYDPDGVTVIGAWSRRPHSFQVGTRWPVDAPTITTMVKQTGRPARVDDYTEIAGAVGEAIRESGICACAGAPIVIDGDVWGVMIACSMDRQPLPVTAEARLADFTDLVATAVSRTAGRAELARLADEQAALRRVATLVARGVPSPEVFAAVAREVGQLLDVDSAHMARYDGDSVVGVASWGTGAVVAGGTRTSLEGESVTARVFRTGRPERVEGYDGLPGEGAAVGREMGLRSSVAAPIVVDQRLWGVMIASTTHEEPLPADTEARILAFTELVATAISNTEARAEATRLTDEQAALRRVATRVAQAVPPSELFGAVAEEVGTLLGADVAGMVRYEHDDSVRVVANWAAAGEQPEVGGRWPVDDAALATTIWRTGQPARMENYADIPGGLAALREELGVRSSVGAPIVVEGRLWGALFVHSIHQDALPPDTESRIGQFTDLMGTAISNFDARSELAASRARVVAAADDERRRVVRDLHDGAQQRLVHTVVTLKLACQALEGGDEAAPGFVTDALDQAERATAELRELAHGIIPAVLTAGGLRAGIGALASRAPVPVETRVAVDRLPAPVEATAYFVVAEALTNVAKHAGAARAEVAARVEDGTLRVEVRDDGVGGARPDGTGLVGLADRLAAIDGRLRVESPAGGGTLVAAAIPLSGTVAQ